MSGATHADGEHWDELQRLFAQFQQLPEGEREAALEAACPDPGLRRRVLDLLRAFDAMQRISTPEEPPLLSIGPYRLLRQIGAGGLGTVYLAERLVDGVTLRSAVKVLAPHAASQAFIERFYREQQHLAALDHPNITRLLDVGWSENQQPYLVMEYVEGMHLDRYCDSNELGVRARLGIFLQICDAVSHAHRSLIVHLDLKPSNVLVTAAGAVKLLDFGTSKLLQIDGNPTVTIMATPAYASPEQLLNEPVGTASDVYGLGAVLFNLLVGETPFGKTSTTGRIEAASRAVDPDPVTRAVTDIAAKHRGLTALRLRQTIQGDLAAIVAACLRSSPRMRYASVDALSLDIKRHLDCQPVLIRGNTVTYTMGKFIRRHRWPVSIVGSVLVTVSISLGYAFFQQERALREAERSVRMQTFMTRLFKMANPDYTAKAIATVPEFLRAGMARLPSYIRDPADLRQAQLGLAESMFESGDLADARAALNTVITTADRAGAQSDKAEAEAIAGSIEFLQGHSAAGRRLEADALQLARTSGPPRVRILAENYYAFNEENGGFNAAANVLLLESAVKEARANHLPYETSLSLSSLATVQYMRGETLAAKAIYEQLLPIYSADPLALCDLSETYGWLAWISNTTGEMEASLPLFRKAYEGFTECAGPGSRMALDELPYWASSLVGLGRGQEAVQLLENALPAWRQGGGVNPEQAVFLHFLAASYVAVKRYADAERTATEYLASVAGKLSPTHRMIGYGHLVLGQALAGQQRYSEALPHARIALELLAKGAVSKYALQLNEQAALLKHQTESALGFSPTVTQ